MDRRTAKEFLHIQNWLIHQYDMIDRDVTWATLHCDLPIWIAALSESFAQASQVISSTPDQNVPSSEGKENE